MWKDDHFQVPQILKYKLWSFQEGGTISTRWWQRLPVWGNHCNFGRQSWAEASKIPLLLGGGSPWGIFHLPLCSYSVWRTAIFQLTWNPNGYIYIYWGNLAPWKYSFLRNKSKLPGFLKIWLEYCRTIKGKKTPIKQTQGYCRTWKLMVY